MPCCRGSLHHLYQGRPAGHDAFANKSYFVASVGDTLQRKLIFELQVLTGMCTIVGFSAVKLFLENRAKWKTRTSELCDDVASSRLHARAHRVRQPDAVVLGQPVKSGICGTILPPACP